MSNQPTDREIINRGVELLEAGVLASALPNRLMSEFGLTPEKAGEMTGRAISRQRRGKVDKEPDK